MTTPRKPNRILQKLKRQQANGQPPPGPPAADGQHQQPSQQSAAGSPPRRPAVTIAEYRPFPAHALPPSLREFVAEVSAANDCDPVFVALHALAVAGAAAGNAVEVRLKRGFEQPPLVWGCVVADSGTGKSPGLKPTQRIAAAVNKRRRAEHLEALKRYKADLEAFEARDGADPKEKPVTPVRQSFAEDDSTVEALIVSCNDSPHGLVMIHDELDSWFNSFARYQGKSGGSDVAKWLKVYDAGWTKYKRRTGTPAEVECERTFVAVTGGIQPGVLKRHLGGDDPAHVHSGLAARLLLAWPPKRCMRWTDREPSQEAVLRFARAVNALADLPYDDRDGPAAVAPSPAALELYKRQYDLNADRAENHDGGPMAAAYPKASGQAARLALIIHCVAEADAGRDPARSQIGEAAMAGGIRLAEWFAHEAGRVYAMLAESAEDERDRSLCGLIARKGGHITVRELIRCNRPNLKTAAAAEAALDALATAGRGRWVPGKNGSGRVVRHFELVSLDSSTAGDPDDDCEPDPDGPE